MWETERLILRRWREEDVARFVAITMEPEVAEWMGEIMHDEASVRLERYNRSVEENGFGRMAVERKADGVVIGANGIMPAYEALPIAGRPEVGWRLARDAWGQGFAVEAARYALQRAFADGVPEVLAITGPGNLRSQAVMTRLGMMRTPQLDFENEEFPLGHRFRPSVVFAITNPSVA